MGEQFPFRERLQIEVEASLADVLSILELGALGPQPADAASFVADAFLQIPTQTRKCAILDPRVVASLENIQRLIATYDRSALVRRDWRSHAGVILRLEAFCLLHLQRSGMVALIDPDDELVSIPGTSLYVSLKTSGNQIQIDRGAIVGCEVVDSGITPDDQTQRCSLPYLAFPEKILQPPIANKRIPSLSPDQRDEWITQTVAAFRLLELDAPSQAFVEEYVRILVPLEDEKEGFSSSASFNVLPGAIYLSSHSRLMLAETLVHEADHQWLYTVTRFESLWEVPDHDQSLFYRSPWRSDPRPVDGLLRGASAFVRVASMWWSVSNALSAEYTSMDWIQNRAVLCNYQAVDALKTVQFHGGLTEFGNDLLLSLIVQATDTRERLRNLKDFPRYTRQASRLQSDHDLTWLKQHPGLERYSLPLCEQDYLSFQKPN